MIHLAAYFDFTGEEHPLYTKVNIERTRRLLLLHGAEEWAAVSPPHVDALDGRRRWCACERRSHHRRFGSDRSCHRGGRPPVNILLGAALLVVPFVHDASVMVMLSEIISGVLLILLSLRRGPIRNRYGTWNQRIV